MSWLKNRVVGNIIALCLSLCVFLVMFEIIVRIFLPQRIESPLNYYAPDSDFGWKMKPNLNKKYTAADFSMVVKTNEKGFRDVSHSYEKPNDTFRIVGIGDSMLAGTGVENEDIVLNRLDELLTGRIDRFKGVETINLGVSGYNTNQYEQTLRLEGSRYKPDLTIMFFYVGNDWSLDKTYSSGGVNKQGFLIRAGPSFSFDSIRNFLVPLRFFFKSHSQAYMLVRDRAKGLLMKSKLMAIPKVDIYRKEHDLEKRYPYTLEKIKEVDQYCKNVLKCSFILCIIPEKVQVRKPLMDLVVRSYQLNIAEYDFLQPQHVLTKYCRQNNIDFVDLTESFARAEEKWPTYLELDIHLNKYGHLLAAQELFKHIAQRKVALVRQ